MQMRGVSNFEGSHTAVGSWLSQFMLCKLNSTTLKLSRWVCPDTNAQLSHLKNVDGALSHIQLNLFPIIGENPHNGLKYVLAFLTQAVSSAQPSAPAASLAERLRGLSAPALPSAQQQTRQRNAGRQANQAPAPLACHSHRSGWWGFSVRWRVAGRGREKLSKPVLVGRIVVYHTAENCVFAVSANEATNICTVSLEPMNGDRLTGQEQKIGLNMETVQFQDIWGKSGNTGL